MIAIVLLLTAISFLVLIVDQRRRRRLPPGPIPWPILGNALALGSKPYLTLSQWVNVYGNIFFTKFFHQEVIILSDAKLVREAFNNPKLAGRPRFPNLEQYFEGKNPGSVNYSVSISEGQPWVERRRFTTKHLHGFRKDSNLYSLLYAEIHELVTWAQGQVGKPIDLARNVTAATANVMWILICGEKLVKTEVEISQFDQASNDFYKAFDSPLIQYYPSVAKFFGNWSGWNKFKGSVEVIHEIMRPAVEKRLQIFSNMTNQEPADFLDSCIKEIQNTDDPNSAFYMSYDSIMIMARDLLLAGFEGVRVEMQWAFLYLTAFPEVQRKLQNEIDANVGREEMITLDHLDRLPYAQAVVRETLRKGVVPVLGLPHKAMESVKFQDYVIPKGAWVAANVYHIQHDPKVWTDPDNFRPERFLTVDSKGKTLLRHYDEFLIFSVGKRQCVGEQLAKEEMFLYIANLFQKFTMRFDPETVKEPNFGSRTAGMRTAYAHKVILSAR